MHTVQKRCFNDGYYEFYRRYNAKQLNDFHKHALPWLNTHLPKNPNGRILDAGCGPGLSVGYLLRLGYWNVIGIDVSPTQVEAAAAHGLKHHVFQADLFDYLAKPPQLFDLIICSDVVEHVPKITLLRLPELFKGALKPGGSIIIRTVNADSPIAARARYIDFTHELSFTDHSLRQLMALGGFEGEVISQHAGKAKWKRLVFAVRDYLWRLIYRVYESQSPLCPDASLTMRFWQETLK
jgi:2-polyprenyl-3-methyl-5-hydroxy-6-metoxy-1,4-benzoquinol methylase